MTANILLVSCRMPTLYILIYIREWTFRVPTKLDLTTQNGQSVREISNVSSFFRVLPQGVLKREGTNTKKLSSSLYNHCMDRICFSEGEKRKTKTFLLLEVIKNLSFSSNVDLCLLFKILFQRHPHRATGNSIYLNGSIKTSHL